MPAVVDEDDELLLVLLLTCLQLNKEVKEATDAFIRQQKRLNRRRPKQKNRPTWHSFLQRVSPQHFRRMFRMPIASFEKLCDDICAVVSQEVFRPEAFLSHGGLSERPTSLALQHQGGCIPGEIKSAMSLRMLAGGSHLDMVPLFDVVKSQACEAFDTFIRWVIRTYRFPLVCWLRNDDCDRLHQLASDFGEKTGGVLCGCFGAIDGIAMRIQSPKLRDVSDPGNCCCRKGFCALNVQAICDKKKRFLWVNPMNKGSAHDSTAFNNCKLWDLLCEKNDRLVGEGLHLDGDSAYPLTGFLQVPCELPDLQSDPTRSLDAFNCYHSANRIYIECAFGEFVMRWGIFWRALRFDLKKCGMIIQAAMLLHNFIIDERHGNPHDDFDRNYFSNFRIDGNQQSQQRLTQATGEQPRALVTDNNEPRPAGRPSNQDAEHRRQGQRIRNSNLLKLAHHNFQRPILSNMRLNAQGHVHMDY